MGLSRFALCAALAAAAPAAAQIATYENELSLIGSYEGGKTDEPLVIVGGTPASGFVFRGDEIERALAVSGTHLLRPAPDDGTTPFALLAFVARVPFVRADASLAARSADSAGTSSGQQVSITSRLTGDAATRAAGLSGEWFLGSATSARGGVSGTWVRETDSTVQTESPSGRADLANQAARSSAGRLTLGAARRLAGACGLEAEVALDGAYGWRSFRRDDALLFPGGELRSFRYDLGSRTRSLELSAKALLLGRRLLLEARGSYLSASGALTQDETTKIDRTRAIARTFSGAATFFPARALGVTAGFAYETETNAAGLVSTDRTAAARTVSWSAGVRFFATPRLSAAAAFTRSAGVTLVPPEGPTFQRLEATTNRLELSGSIRF